VRDPLFFLLHANIDRLWARWQVEKGRFDSSSEDAYSPQGSSDARNCVALGQAADDTMWPWNGATRPADRCRPPTAPGGAFPAAPGLLVPPQQPRPRDLIDYRTSPASLGGAGFSYDDVPFDRPPPKASS
jgi:tyrosinase